MNWTDLQEMAKAIVSSTPQGDFEDKTFCLGSGGLPVNRCGVQVLHENVEFAYNTTANGSAYKGWLTVRCRVTPGKDKEGRPIYEDEAGTLFVFTYGRGSASSFDSGSLRSPVLA